MCLVMTKGTVPFVTKGTVPFVITLCHKAWGDKGKGGDFSP